MLRLGEIGPDLREAGERIGSVREPCRLDDTEPTLCSAIDPKFCLFQRGANRLESVQDLLAMSRPTRCVGWQRRYRSSIGNSLVPECRNIVSEACNSGKKFNDLQYFHRRSWLNLDSSGLTFDLSGLPKARPLEGRVRALSHRR